MRCRGARLFGISSPNEIGPLRMSPLGEPQSPVACVRDSVPPEFGPTSFRITLAGTGASGVGGVARASAHDYGSSSSPNPAARTRPASSGVRSSSGES